MAPGFLPDYSKPEHQVYLEFALYWIQTHKNLDLFSRIKDRGSKFEGKYTSKLPSWVPDWTHIDGFSPNFIDIQAAEKLPYHASNDEPAEVSYSPELEVLFIKGFIFDTIELVPDEPQWSKSIQDPQSANWQQWHVLALGNPMSEKLYGSEVARQEAYWRTLVAGCDSNGDPAPESYGQQFYDWAGLSPSLPSNTSTKSTSQTNDEVELNDIVTAGTEVGLLNLPDTSTTPWRTIGNEFKSRLFKIVNIRRVFVTKKGYLGIGPDDVKPGDEIAILYGGKMPFVVRTRECNLEGNGIATGITLECYELIDGGECYVHGIMDGEVVISCTDEQREQGLVMV